MSADVPLLNDYKKIFVRNRIFQTLLGGIRIFGVPWYTVILQIFIFHIPVIVIVVVYSIYHFTNLDHWQNYLIFACIFAFLAFCLQIIGKIFHWISFNHTDNQVHQIHELLEEENSVDINGFVPLCKFLIPGRKNWFNVIFHRLVYCIFSSPIYIWVI